MLTFANLIKWGGLRKPNEWWDRWDIDIDFDVGVGNGSEQDRRKELFRAAELLRSSLSLFDRLGRRDVQVWLMLHSKDSREDRLYFHSANNINGTPWPRSFDDYLVRADRKRVPLILRQIERTLPPYSVCWYRALKYPNLWYLVPIRMLAPPKSGNILFRIGDKRCTG